MSYSPINTGAFVSAFSGAISGMAVGSGWLIDPVSSHYAAICNVAGAYAQAFDQAWNNATALTVLEAGMIESASQAMFEARGSQPATSSSFQNPSNWAIGAAAVVALVRQGDTYFTTQGITPPTPGGGGNGTRRARVVYLGILPVDKSSFDLGPGVLYDGVQLELNDVFLAIGEGTGPQGDLGSMGPWQVTTVNVGANTGAIARPDWWPTGATMHTSEVPIELGAEGLIYSNTRFRTMGAQTGDSATAPTNTFVIGTDNPGFYPEQLTTLATLVNGLGVVAHIPVLSTGTGVTITDSGIGEARPSSTAYYGVELTPGQYDIGGLIIHAYGSEGTVDTNNQSTVLVTLNNQYRIQPLM